VVKLLLEKGIDPNPEAIEYGQTLLSLAVGETRGRGEAAARKGH
jgi:hypothetical protein